MPGKSAHEQGIPRAVISRPPRLYRYTTLERLQGILRDAQLYFPPPSSFNDPFDCKLFPTFEASAHDYQKHMEHVIKEKNPGMSRAERRRLIKEFRPVIGKKLFEEAYRRTLERITKFGVLCLSEKWDDILMWSHNADKHTGACLIFDTVNDFFASTMPVKYRVDYPRVNFLELTRGAWSRGALSENEQRAFVELIYLTKANHWSYEREWRIISFSRKQPSFGFHPFPPNCVLGVVLGCRATSSQCDQVRQWIRDGQCKPTLYIAKVSERKFALDIAPAKS